MKITICGSLNFIEEMKKIRIRLNEKKHEALMPESAIQGQDNKVWENLRLNNKEEYAKIKGKRILLHFNKINSSDAILVLNYDKHEKKNYIGPNTFLEMGYAFGVGKKIFTINPLPEDRNHEELVSLDPICLNNDLNNIK